VRVLSLVTSSDASFFEVQVRTLERMGVDCTTVGISTTAARNESEKGRRSVGQYARFYSTALRRSFGDYDLVHANYGLTAPAAVVQPNLPVVLSLWGSDLMGRIGPATKLFARFADEVVVMSDRMAAMLDQPCHVIPHGVDTDRFEPLSKGQCREELGWARDQTHVLFPYGTRRAVKNYPRAERVVAAARDRLDGPVELHTVSGVAHDRMPIYMNAADTMVLTSRHEGSPNTVKEALACNLPVVTVDVGDVAEQVAGVSGAAVCRSDEELVQALVETLEEPLECNGREKVEREMSAERMGERLLAVYEQALA
jgi:glycosyltransferase involved in cell wall biosynthesis